MNYTELLNPQNSAVMAVVKEHCGAYGQGVEYAYTMVHGAPPSCSGAGG